MPEEINRVVTDHVSELLFCPTDTALRNLATEGLESRSMVVGDVMYDASLYYRAVAREQSSILDDLGLREQEYVLATCHRAENTDDPGRLREILQGLAEIASRKKVVLPMHPRTRLAIEQLQLGGALKEINVIEPIPFLDMIRLEESAHMIITDSGGVQKEAYFFRVPCITMRDETEWVETIDAGWNSLVGANRANIVTAAERSHRPEKWPAFYGDGRAGEMILGRLLEAFQN
jgi:UDP-GlcNAc3NAcA epimerase